MSIKRLAVSLIVASLIACVGLVGFAGDAQAALVFHSGFETSLFNEWSSVVGSPSVVETQKKTGDYAMQCDTTGGAATAYVYGGTATAYKVSAYIYITTAPSGDCAILGSTGVINVRLTSDRHLKLHDGGVLADTGTTELATETFYRVSLCTTSAGAGKIYLNGVEECSAVGMTKTFTNDVIGVITAVTADIYFDNIATDNTESTDDLSDIRVLRSVPIADSAVHDDWKDTGDGPICWDDVDECPASVADYAWFEANGVLNEQTFTGTTCTTLGLGTNDTINAISSWWYYSTGGGGGVDEYFNLVRDNSTDYLTSVDDPKNGGFWVNRYDAVMPNGGGTWTQERCDAFEFGMATDDANKDIWLYTAYKMVAYIPAAVGEPDITISPTGYSFGVVATSSTPSTSTSYFTVDNNSTIQTDQTISVTTSTWSGGVTWTHSDTATPGENTAGLKANRGGTWGVGDIIVKNASPNYIYENCPATTDYSFGLKLWAPTSFTDGVLKEITVRITAVAG